MFSSPNPDETIYRFLVHLSAFDDPRAVQYLRDAHALGITKITRIDYGDLFFIQGNLSQRQVDLLVTELLHDPVTQSIEWQKISMSATSQNSASMAGHVIEVSLRPGVTDPVAEQIVRASHLLQVDTVQAASTGQHFVIHGDDLTVDDLHRLAKRLLCNPVIQRYALGEISPSFPLPAASTGTVDRFQVGLMEDEDLLKLSQERRAALNLDEMHSIRRYCQSEDRDLTDIEFEMIAQTWSEHCVHKTFKARITLQDGQIIDNLFKHTIQSATQQIHADWVLSAFSDNAGIIRFDAQYEVSFKVETHNHPSAIEPFGGANTGIGGVIRDLIGVSARPIAATDVLCFGPQELNLTDLPEGVLHPQRIASGVVSGIEDYGNKIGIPTMNGAVLYDPGYTSNPLVFCGCVGIAPLNSHPRQVQAGDHVIVIGGRTGRDGLRGATFSSMTMDAQTGEVAGASVQIGAPIVEKGLIDVVIKARDGQFYHAITDCGAGGLSSAVGEMASEIGAVIELGHVPLKYPGLAPWEIWLSEAQERMVLAVPPQNLKSLAALCDIYEVEMTDIGIFNAGNRLEVCYEGKTVLNLDTHFLHKGIPQRNLTAILPQPVVPAGMKGMQYREGDFSYSQILLKLLSHPNISSKESIIRVYDHEVQGGTVVRPLMGAQNDGPSDGCVIKPAEGQGSQAFALAAGINPEYGKLDPYQMAYNVIDEALRNAVAVGADPARVAILDNFCWGDPLNPNTLGEFTAAALGCQEAAVAYGTPFISGKDSFNNEYLGSDGKRHAIPPTLLISAIGLLENWENAVTMDLKSPGNSLYLVGKFEPCLGGSHLDILMGFSSGDGIPACDAVGNLRIYTALHAAMTAQLVRSCHDLSEGGLGVAAAEMCMGGRLGLELNLPAPDPLRFLFGETTGCLLVEVHPDKVSSLGSILGNLQYMKLGTVCQETSIRLNCQGVKLVDLTLDELLQAWKPMTKGTANQ